MRLAEWFIVGSLIGVLLILVYTDKRISAINEDRMAKEKALITRIMRLEGRSR